MDNEDIILEQCETIHEIKQRHLRRELALFDEVQKLERELDRKNLEIKNQEVLLSIVMQERNDLRMQLMQYDGHCDEMLLRLMREQAEWERRRIAEREGEDRRRAKSDEMIDQKRTC